MYRLLLSLCLLVSLSGTILASVVSPEKARLIASEFISTSAGVSGYSLEQDQPLQILSRENINTLYVFGLAPKGFVMISADDASYPVPCFSTESNYISGNLPENLKSWIDGYSNQVLYAIQTGVEPDTKTSGMWNQLSGGNAKKSSGTIVGPLIVSTWDQGYPYNYLCPEDNGGSGGHVWAGCVATAMSQVANYWRWPLEGTGSHGYYSDYGYLFADYGNSAYNWEEMTNSAEGENFQMAQIQYHMGIAVNMMYGPGGSGAYSDDAADALISYFGMDPGLHLEYAPNPINENWKSLIRSEIDAGRPLYYHGFGTGGHAFNLDGYNGPDYFHFNWGWSGSFNGYYYLDNLNPGGSSFTEGQGAIVGIKPSDNYPYYCNSTDTLTMFSGTIEDGSGPTQPYLGNSNCGWLIIPQDSILSIKLTFHRFDLGNEGDSLIIYDGPGSDAPMLAAYTGSSLPPVTSSNGSSMFIKFVSNSAANSGGWFASYEAVRAVFCSGITTFTDAAGSLEDGSGTFDYHPNSVCRYRIVPENAASITLTFDEFDTFDENDYLKVYDHTNNTLISTFFGHDNPGTITYPTGKLLLMFHSDTENNSNGWKFRYTSSVNTGTTDAKPGFIASVSPNPASGFVNVDLVNNGGKYELSLYSPQGVRLFHKNFNSGFSGLMREQIPVEEFPAGLYILVLNSESGSANYKIVIRH